MTQLRIGLVGVGDRAKIHLKMIPLLKDKYKLVAVCGATSRRVSGVGKELEVSAYTDIEKMVNKENLDVALISVQAEGHQIIADYLAKHKIHIISETPIALTLSCIDTMIESAKNNGVFLEVSENVWRWPNERVKQNIVSSGLIGQVKSFHLSYHMGSYHGINAIRKITGSEALEVNSNFINETNAIEKSEIKMSDGINGTYCNNVGERKKYWHINGTKGSLIGNKLNIFDSDIDYEIHTKFKEEGGKRSLLGSYVDGLPEVSWENPYAEYSLGGADDVACMETLMSMYNAIIHGFPLTYDACEARKDMELLLAIRESSTKGGASIKLPLKCLTEYEALIHSEFKKVYGEDCLEMNHQQLKKNYSLPEGLKDLMYLGRQSEVTLK